ncbi:phosphopantetheine-binding protein (plasmid) [Streptomyces sp. NBC_00341]|uniref:acyl carrier protein n=1 Tax=unclassified Streptomyces TaxID=2593676 RepID=UPI00093BA383|nr:phosphopantetheine-binding protein [Streptomyces sp. CB02488]OKK13175.1 hypothetical protein AMK09_28395 [Streptomyces sp. CB02488]WRZ16929.1 phosphopantetheine-binding protein [Streptomyces sp. NBC_00341]
MSPPVPVEDDTRTTVYAIVGAMAPVPDTELTDETALAADLGYDSLRLIELTLALEQGFALPELGAHETATAGTLGDVVRLVSAARLREAAK